MIGYNTLYKSMNGIRVLSDGISLITDGTAKHEDIIYENTIKSDDGRTVLNNNNINTEIVSCLNLNCDDLDTTNIDADNINCNFFTVIDLSGNDVFKIDGVTNNMIYAYKEMEFNNKLNVINAQIHQTQTGILYQQGTGENYLKDTKINGYLKLTSNLTQSGGSAQLLDLTVGEITQTADKSITQSGANVSNSFAGTTQMKNLVITGSVVFPAEVEVPAVTTSDDIVMNGNSVILQDITAQTTKENKLRNTRTLNLYVDGNIVQGEGGGTATLKNTTIQGDTQLQGDILQTSGSTQIKTLRCNNITLNDDQTITMSGTGYITQSGTGTNLLKKIEMTLNSDIVQNGGILSQSLGGVNVFSHFRSLGIAIIQGRNATSHYANAHSVSGLQFQYGRTGDNHCYIMSNRPTGANGAIRFQRYAGNVFKDEPLVIDDTITMNKNLSIPAGSLTCASASLGNISQEELNCLESINYNIKDKFTNVDEQIGALSNSSNNSSLALTGISYTDADDTTTIDNNLKVNKNANLTNLFSTFAKIDNTITLKNDLRLIDVVSKNENIFTQLYHANAKTAIINYSSNGTIGFQFKSADNTTLFESVSLSRDTTQINNNLLIGTTNVLTTLNTNTSNISNLQTITSGISYGSSNDTTTIDNNLTVNKTLLVQGMNIKAEIDALESSFTTGTITTTDLKASNIYIDSSSKFGEKGGSTFIKNDIRICDVVSKSENVFSQIYQAGIKSVLINHVLDGNMGFQFKNATDTALIETINLTRDNTTINNNLIIGTMNVKTNIEQLNNKTSGISYDANTGNTTINNLEINDNAIDTFQMNHPTFSYSKYNSTQIGFDDATNFLIYRCKVCDIFYSGSNYKSVNVNFPISFYRTGIVYDANSPNLVVSFNKQFDIEITESVKFSSMIGKVYIDDVFYADAPIIKECSLFPTDDCFIKFRYPAYSLPKFEYQQYVGTFSCNINLPNLNKSSKITLYFENEHSFFCRQTSNGVIYNNPVYQNIFNYQSDTDVISFIPTNNNNISYGWPPVFDGNPLTAATWAFGYTRYPQLTSYQKYMNTTIKTYQNNNMFIPNNNKSLSTTNLYTNNITVQNNLSTKISTAKYGGIPGYVFVGNDTRQIICSLSDIGKIYGVADNDDGYIINPGYKFYLYEHPNYAGAYYGTENNLLVFDNTEGTEPIYKQNTIAPNRVGSIKVFWFNEEIIINGLS